MRIRPLAIRHNDTTRLESVNLSLSRSTPSLGQHKDTKVAKFILTVTAAALASTHSRQMKTSRLELGMQPS